MTDLHDLNTRNDNKEGGQMKKFWMCYVEGTDGGCHYRHQTLKGALIEAERLARLPSVRGKTVYLFECVAICSAQPLPVKWEIYGH